MIISKKIYFKLTENCGRIGLSRKNKGGTTYGDFKARHRRDAGVQRRPGGGGAGGGWH